MIDTEMTTISISVRSTVPITVKVFLTGPAFFFFSFLLFWSGSRLSHMLGSCFVSGFFGEFLFVAQNIFLLIRDMLGHKHVILHYIT